jgi:uncharacterized protein (TIGR03067 family)
MKTLFAWGLAVVLLTGLAMAGDTKDDKAKLQGTWKAEVEGKKAEFKFDKDNFTGTFSEGEGKTFVVKGTVTLDAKKKPKEMDIKITDFPVKELVGKTIPCIYDVDGDTLKWCAGDPDKGARPKEFPAKEGEGKDGIYLVLKRAK